MSYLDDKPYKVNHINLNPIFDNGSSDCSIRAIMIATGKTTPEDWLKIYDDLYKLSKLKFRVYNSLDNIASYLSFLNFEMYVRPNINKLFDNIYNEIPERITVDKFIQDHMVGTYIIFVHKHTFTVIDGIVYERSNLDYMTRHKRIPKRWISGERDFFETYIEAYAVKKGN